MNYSNYIVSFVLVVVGIICCILAIRFFPVMGGEKVIKAMPWIIGTIIAISGLIYTAASYNNSISPFDPEYSIGNWVNIGTSSLNSKIVPSILLSINVKNEGSKLGTISNVALQVDYIVNDTIETKIFKALREVSSVEVKNSVPMIQEIPIYTKVEEGYKEGKIVNKVPIDISDMGSIDVFHPISVKGKEEVRKIYGFILDDMIENYPESPELVLTLWIKIAGKKEWTKTESLSIIDDDNTWKSIRGELKNSWHIKEARESISDFYILSEHIKQTNQIENNRQIIENLE